MAPLHLLLLLLLLSSSDSLPPPRTSFLLNSTDRPLTLFSLPDVHNTTSLLLSHDGSTLFVGARDAVLSLDVSQSDVISLRKKVEWRPSQSEINDCRMKGKNATVDCPNFVRVLQLINSTHLYACGSFAFSPHDVFIDAESFSMVRHVDVKTKIRCPFSPLQRNTAITVDGELFTATPTSFRGGEPQISRHFSKGGRQDVSQDTSAILLEEPTFVASSSDPSERKLYFFFSEVGKEFSFVDELQIARVAQVCKDDVGGLRTLQNKWTSFAKAPLLCQLPKHLPFSVLQDVFSLQPAEGANTSDTLFYAVFTSQWSSSPESAVCVFKLQDVQAVFSGSYRTFDWKTHQWSSTLRNPNLGQCGLDTASDFKLDQVKENFLTSGSVKPVGGGPVVVSSGHRYSHVTAMRTQAANGRQYTVLFLLTESGFLHKVVLLDRGVQVIEEIQVFTQPQLVRSSVLYSSSKGVVYVGTAEGVTGVPVARCSAYSSCSQCVLARDPLCGWSRTSSTCTRVGGAQDDVAQDLEDGSVAVQCRGETRTVPVTEVVARVNEAVRLRCLRPSALSSLTWTSSRFGRLPPELFIQSADGSLSFLPAADTFGKYRCEAEEGGYKEVVSAYDVRPVASPRSFSPLPGAERRHVTPHKDESYEEIETEEPERATAPPSGDAEDEFTTDLKDETVSDKVHSGLKNDVPDDGSGVTETSRRDFRQETAGEKSYYSELVSVSLLLAVCVCVLMLAGAHMWLQRKTALKTSPLVSPEDGSRTMQSMESVPSLSPEDGPELKVVD